MWRRPRWTWRCSPRATSGRVRARAAAVRRLRGWLAARRPTRMRAGSDRRLRAGPNGGGLGGPAGGRGRKPRQVNRDFARAHGTLSSRPIGWMPAGWRRLRGGGAAPTVAPNPRRWSGGCRPLAAAGTSWSRRASSEQQQRRHLEPAELAGSDALNGRGDPPDPAGGPGSGGPRAGRAHPAPPRHLAAQSI